VDRAHREFSEEQVRNIAVINCLHRGEPERFTGLVHRYFERGMEKLTLNKDRLKQVSVTLAGYLDRDNGIEMPDFSARLEEINRLQEAYKDYLPDSGKGTIEKINHRQRALAAAFAPFFAAIHDMLKVIDRKVRRFEKEHGNSKEGKAVKVQLDELHGEIKESEYFFTHIRWLQDRFPAAAYEDVTGLCKLASLEEVREQDYSLNPGRYVGVVIEEDGKTEEEFIEDILALNDELNKLNDEAKDLEITIKENIKVLVGEDE
jgi:type I restriction enzyme M protein